MYSYRMDTNPDDYSEDVARVAALLGRSDLSDEEQADVIETMRSAAERQHAAMLPKRQGDSAPRPRVSCIPFRMPGAPRATPTPQEPDADDRPTVGRVQFNVAPPDPRPQRGVTISDDYGSCEYDVVLTEAGDIKYLTIRPFPGETLATVQRLSEAQLALTAATFLDDSAIDHSVIAEYVAHDAPMPEPSLAYVGRVLRRAQRIASQPGGRAVSARKALEAATGKSLPTVDRWIRAARAADKTLPQATRDPRGIEK